jgi:putative tricarboxylic transport membrane protein
MAKFGAAARVFSVAVLAFCATPALAEYPDRNIDLIVPYGPGGGFDVYARAIGRIMEKHLPNDVKIIVRNMPGAASIKGTTAMYRAAPDGYTMGIVNLLGALVPAILNGQSPYDLDKVTWLGLVNIGTYSLIVGKKSPFQTLNDFLKPKGRLPYFATTGSSDYQMAKIAMHTLKIKAHFLTSYRGGPATHLAIIKGEADAGMGIDVTIARHIKAGELKQLVWFQKKSSRGAPKGVPTAEELANLALYRVFSAPPGLPAGVRKTLVDAVQKALHDPEFVKWSAKVHFPIDPGTAEEVKKLYVDQKDFLTANRALLK